MVLGSIEDLLREAVVETIATGSPESARDRVEELVDVDEGLGLVGSGSPPAQGTALLSARELADDGGAPGVVIGRKSSAGAGTAGTRDPSRAP